MRKLLFVLMLAAQLACGDDDNNSPTSNPLDAAADPVQAAKSDASVLQPLPPPLDADGGVIPPLVIPQLDAGLATPDASAPSAPSVPTLSPAYLLMHTVESPEGRQNYVMVSKDLKVGEIDNKLGLEVSGASRAFAIGGAVFVADAESLAVRKFNVDANLKLVPAGEVSFANFGITYFDTGFTFIDDQTAWYMASDVLKVLQFNPSTMKLTGTIDLSVVGDPVLTTYIDGGQKVGDYVFAGVWYYGDQYTVYGKPELKVVVISTTEQKVVKVLTDSHCVTAGVLPKLPNGDLLVMGSNQGGTLRYYSVPPVSQPNCLMRIKAGSTEFDTTFYKNLDELTAPNVDASSFNYVDALGKALVWAREPGTFATEDAFYTDTVWRPSLLDVQTWTNEPVNIPGLVNKGGPGGVLVIDGKLHFYNARSDGKTGGAFSVYENGALTELITFSEWLQVVQRVR